MNTETTSRLWPVLLTLVLLPVGASLLENLGRLRGASVKVIHVEAVRQENEDDLEIGGPAVDEAHQAARDAMRRGDVSNAVVAYGALAEKYPASAAIALEQGSALLAAKNPTEALTALLRAKEAAPNEERVAVTLARAYSRQKNATAAEAELRRALVLRPGYAPALRALGRALSSAGKKQEAIELLGQAAEFGNNEDRANALVDLGSALLDAGRVDDARAAFDKAIERAPARVEIRIGIARAYLSTDKKEDAQKASGVLAVAADLAPDLAEVQTLTGQARETIGDDDGAEEAYWQSIRMAPQATFPRRRLLRIALNHQRFQKAQQHVDELLQIDSSEPEHHFLAGLVAGRQGNVEQARAHYRTAIEKAEGDYPEAFLNLGSVEKDEKNLDAAIAAYRKALELRPGYHAAENNLGLALIAAGKIDEAERLYKEVLSRTPSYAPAWLNLGKLYSQKKQYPEAIDAYSKALEVKPNYTRALLDQGVAFARSGRLDDAIGAYKKVIEQNPRSVSGWYNLALVQLQKADKVQAEQSLRKALELDPSHVSSTRKLAGLLVEKNAIEEARALYEDVLDDDPHDIDARLAHAELLRRTGDRQGCARDAAFALRDAQKAAEKNPEGSRVTDAANLQKTCSGGS